jgi:D-amino peptidase
MKVYISVDMEGVTGVSAWEDVNSKSKTYERYRSQMNKEALAAIEGCLEAGAKEIVVKDAHATARNLFFPELPDGVKLINGWSGCPGSMVQGIDSSFDALVFVGYHSGAYSGANPLSHTMSSRKIFEMTLNGQRVSEFDIHAVLAAEYGVPCVFLSGDDNICNHSRSQIPSISTYSTLEGVGNSAISKSPNIAITQIRSLVKDSLKTLDSTALYPVSSEYELSIKFIDPQDAYRASFYPGAEQRDDRTVTLKSTKIWDSLTFLKFNL